MEIKRKFQINLNTFRESFPYEHITYIDQAWLRINSEDEQERFHEIRHSRRYSRITVEQCIISLEQYQRMYIPGAPMLRKARYACLPWMFDEYLDRHRGLAMVEIILEETKSVRFPKWLKPHIIQEVTDLKEFRQLNLALYGLPRYLTQA